MKKLSILAFFIAFLLGCHAPSRLLHTNDADALGAQTAINLTTRYHKKVIDCGPARPAYLCSGIMLRGTVASESFFFWNPSPLSVSSGGVSFSFLREDAKYIRLSYGYTSGFIFQPYLESVRAAVQPEVLCSFPVDSWTLERDEKGCGQYQAFPGSSRQCQSQGITTAAQWLAHYQSVPSEQRARHQCGFNVSEALGGTAASAFYASLQARALGSDDMSIAPVQNELRLATWAQDIGRDLPVEALFYTPGGLAGAQNDQRNFYLETDKWVPIIALTLPATPTGNATFTYRSTDQAFFPGGPLSISHTLMALNGFRIFASWPQTGADAMDNVLTRRAVGGAPPYRYVSSNPQVASVTPGGKVTGIRRGNTTITVSDSSTPTQSLTYSAQVSNTWLLGVVQPGTFSGVADFHRWLIASGGFIINSSGQFQNLERLYAQPFPLPRGRYWLGEHGGACPAGYYTYYHAEHTNALACALPGEPSVTGALYVIPH
ncbi:hypothetical protein J2W43_004488 [Pseudomonas brassicacearum]|uniref:BIG2 domain-containing protein n=1 Tax=Pseudomonas brassicacearum TaxID=930166 RepID=A0AAW8MFQ1_9PSED|nr:MULTISPECIES: Ig-like domain-containing protein [Pseudomonas]MDR6960483.1 hypothetical protein [Pseudomonas brassicacearum]UZE16582.1 Ig-like domain-containing protein [Pseudomonas sp. B21-054]